MSQDDEYLEVLDALHHGGVLPHPGWGEGRLESGHFFAVGPPSESSGGQYTVNVKHPGDRTGSHILVHLGRDYAQVPHRLATSLSHPEVMGEMRQQYARATQSGDPHGQSYGGGPGPFTEMPSRSFFHYGY